MNKPKSTGLFGKLPAHGDFIYRDLPTSFINLWDTWLQGFVSSSQEQMGESWLDIYLTSPMWRFVLSPGVIDQRCWMGIMLPSVDRVGRYFPFSIVVPLAPSLAPMDIMSTNGPWFDAMEKSALSALEGSLSTDELVVEINSFSPSASGIYRPYDTPASTLGSVIRMDFEEQAPLSLAPYFMDALLKKTLNSYSIWSTRGSQYVDPCLFYTQGLPQRRGVAAMMDGQWAQWGWDEPFGLDTLTQ